MSTHIFSEEEVHELQQNPHVVKCTDRSITYTFEFKKRALELYQQGVNSKEIWRRAGFDTDTWRKHYAKDRIHNWKTMVKKKGMGGLAETRGLKATGRPKTKGVSDADRIKRLELQVKYLKAENDFLAQLRARRAESNSGRKKNSRSSKN
jgi:transposase-like protein